MVMEGLELLLETVSSSAKVVPYEFGITDGEVKTPRADYMFVPVISLWEQRAAAWSHRPARITIVMSVYDNTGSQPKLLMQEVWQAIGVKNRTQRMEKLLDPLLYDNLNRWYTGKIILPKNESPEDFTSNDTWGHHIPNNPAQ